MELIEPAISTQKWSTMSFKRFSPCIFNALSSSSSSDSTPAADVRTGPFAMISRPRDADANDAHKLSAASQETNKGTTDHKKDTEAEQAGVSVVWGSSSGPTFLVHILLYCTRSRRVMTTCVAI